MLVKHGTGEHAQNAVRTLSVERRCLKWTSYAPHLAQDTAVRSIHHHWQLWVIFTDTKTAVQSKKKDRGIATSLVYGYRGNTLHTKRIRDENIKRKRKELGIREMGIAGCTQLCRWSVSYRLKARIKRTRNCMGSRSEMKREFGIQGQGSEIGMIWIQFLPWNL